MCLSFPSSAGRKDHNFHYTATGAAEGAGDGSSTGPGWEAPDLSLPEALLLLPSTLPTQEGVSKLALPTKS